MIAATAVASDAADWAALSSARLASDFCQSWLQLQCRLIQGAEAGLLLLRETDGSFAPAAMWPYEQGAIEALVPTAERALRERQGVTTALERGGQQVAWPLIVRGELHGVVVLDVVGGAGLGEIKRHLHWGSGWVESLFQRRAADQAARRLDSVELAMQVASAAGAARDLTGAASAAATELALRLTCRRVAIGTLRRGHVRVAGLSHTAILYRNLDLASGLANAMEEAADQDTTTAWPALSETSRVVAVAHRDHARRERLVSVMSVVMHHERRPIGVILLERDDGDPFDATNAAAAECVAALLGPLLAMHQAMARPLAGRVPQAIGDGMGALFGPRRPTVKLATLAASAVIAWLAVATGEDRIVGKATLEGEEVRAATAPFDGYVLTAPRRAGDIVTEGEALATLDTREIALEALRYESQRDQALLRARDAEGKHDRTEAGIGHANAAEAQAQLDLARLKLDQATLRAPFAGIVVSGDLSQQLAAPVERGKVLYEVALLKHYRVVVQADEREIARVQPGQSGFLLLNGLSGDTLPFTVTKIVPVAVAGEGRNTIRVEGSLQGVDERVRPGMEGVGKLVAGRAKLAWIYGHPILDWVRITLWKQLP